MDDIRVATYNFGTLVGRPIKSWTGFPKEASMLLAYRKSEFQKLIEDNMERKHASTVTKFAWSNENYNGEGYRSRGVAIDYRMTRVPN